MPLKYTFFTILTNIQNVAVCIPYKITGKGIRILNGYILNIGQYSEKVYFWDTLLFMSLFAAKNSTSSPSPSTIEVDEDEAPKEVAEQPAKKCGSFNQ